MRTFFVGLLLSWGLSPVASGSVFDVAPDMEKLSQIPAKYEVFGTICEYLTKIRLEDEYPDTDYEIEVGIEYKQGGRTIGEIDVVVFRKADMEAILVGQVKCRRNMSSARRQAEEQNRRFLNTVAGNRGPITYRSTSNRDLVILPSQMDEVHTYITASQDGGEEYGFTMTVGHDLDTVTDMRDELLSCQHTGRCPRPM